MRKTVKLQRIGNSIRATIPKEVMDILSLREGEELDVDVLDDAVLLKKKEEGSVAQLYGILKEKTGKVKRWPTPEEIKSIWE